MDKFIKSVPLIIAVSLLVIVWQVGDAEYTNTTAAILCAFVVVILTAIVYVIMDYFELNLMTARHYVVVMFAAGFLTFVILYSSLEYFYS